MAFYHTACFVFAVMIVCNAILYPTFFGSVLNLWFGREKPQKQENIEVPHYPPHMRGAPPPARGGRMNMNRNGGSPPKPTMAGSGGPGPVDPTAFMAQQQQESSKGRGLMGTVLPIYAVGIFIYFGYVIYKVFLKDKPATPAPPQTSWTYPEENNYRDGPTPQREHEENLQRKLTAELKAANYADFRGEKRATVTRSPRSPEKETPASSNEEVDMLKKRLEDTEMAMQRMMEMMSSMGMAMNQVSQHLASNDKPGPASVFTKLDDPIDSNPDDEILPENIHVDNLTDEEDLIVGDCMDDELQGSSDYENDVDEENDVDAVDDTGNDPEKDIERGRSKKMNIVDVEGDDFYDEDNDDDEVDSDDESDEENAAVEDGILAETLRRRNVKSNDCPVGAGIEG